MDIKAITSIIAGILWVSLAQVVYADQFTIRIQGRNGATLTKQVVQLSDIADVSSPRVQDDEVILALNKIEIAIAPQPGQTLSLTAHDIISKIKAAGVKMSDVGYAFPRVISVKRAARILSEEEVRQAIERHIRNDDAESSVRQVTFPKPTVISPDAKILEVLPTAYAEGAQQKFTLRIGSGSGDSNEVTVPASALVDRWAQVAVLRRPIQKGEIVDAGDVIMARLNLQALPPDAVSDTSKVIGLETKRNLAAGEVLQKTKLNVPTVIKAGEKVTLRYRSALLEATATGFSLDSAGLQEAIRVRNEVSNKVVTGIVSAAGIVEVRQ